MGTAIGTMLDAAGHGHTPAPRTRRDHASAASTRDRQYGQFWARLLERVAHEQPGWTPRGPMSSNQTSLDFRSERFDPAHYAMSFARGGRLRTELYIDHGTRRASEDLYQRLRAEREAIEARYGAALTWESLPGRPVCRVASYAPGHIDEDDRHDEFIAWFMRSGVALRHALGER